MTELFPTWIKVRAPSAGCLDGFRSSFAEVRTVCEECNCPNFNECWKRGHAAFIAMGDVCTRRCRFCAVKSGKPLPLDPEEPLKIARSVAKLGLKHVVVTSVDRDDLPDGGAWHFAEIIYKIRELCQETSIEVLTPDFLNKGDSWKLVASAKPDVFNHNIEVVKRLYPEIKVGAKYEKSLDLLRKIKDFDPDIFTKSGLIVGLGETNDEVLEEMDRLRAAGVDFITIGQYLKPKTTDGNAVKRLVDVDRFVTPDEFKMFEEAAYHKGFSMVSSSPLTRSSYHAGEDFEKLKRARNH